MMTSRSPAAADPRQTEIDELRARLGEAEETLQAIRQGDVDAVVINGTAGPQVYTLLNADRPYRTIVERMQEGALTLTPEGTVLYANQRLAAFLGLGLEHIVGHEFGQFIDVEDRTLFCALLTRNDPHGGRTELALRAADGSPVPVYLSMIELMDEGRTIVSGIVTDLRWPKQRMQELAEANARLVTVMAERERAESRLRHALKMEAVGELTAGLAHDFNNLLAVIGGNLELFSARTGDDWLKARVDASQRAVERGARLTRQLLAFARQQNLQPQAMAVNALLLDIEPLLRSAIGDRIRLQLALNEGLAPCLVDAAELQASILNLAKNAVDAMPAGGCLTIATAAVTLEDVPGQVRGGRYSSINVTDTGHGMPSAVRDRAFDPFFTTKDIGKGTGLGLSQVYGFMRQSDGYVTIDSAAGSGTTVRLFLPVTDMIAPAPAPPPTRPARTTPQSRRVLVVDDDRDIRELVVEVLESLGYTTVAAESGPAALVLLDGGAAVDVVVSDVLMPDGMSGFQLAREIRRRSPNLAIVLTSGMTGADHAAADVMRDLPVLKKPYRCDDLMQAIESALDAAALDRVPA